jgi:hypothetical protein
MRSLVTFIIFLLFGVNFSGQAQSINIFEHILEIEQRLERSNLEIRQLSDLELRLKDYDELYFYNRSLASFLIQEIQHDRPISGTHLNLINRSLSGYLSLTQKLLNEAQFIAPRSIDFRTDYQRSLFWLAIQVKVAESFKTLHSLYFMERGLRAIIRDKTRTDIYGLQSLPELTDIILSTRNASEITRALAKLQSQHSLINEGYLRNIIVESTLYVMVSQSEPLFNIFQPLTFWSDRIGVITDGVTRGLSAGFGAVVGDIEWRTGHLHQHAGFQTQIRNILKPLDIVYEKKTFKLTDYTIPGHWGHNAVWLGTKDQLIELGIWDSPALDFFREKIERGENIYEVRRWGLQFDTLENFLNLDELAITRVPSILQSSTRELEEIYLNLANQWGKTYDFSFNALATDRVTCTEIIFLSYGEINWPRGIVVGRTAITPNNMAELVFYQNSPMELVGYYRAQERHQVQTLTINDFASTLGFVRRGRNAQFEKHYRRCENVITRRFGAIRMQYQCRDEYEVIRYRPPSVFQVPTLR